MYTFILRSHDKQFGAKINEVYLVIQTTLGIPQLPRNLLQVGASVEQIMRVRMKDRKDGGLLD
jgi:hypothetical protein